LHGAGADAIALDAALITTAQYDALAEQVDAGLSLWLGVLPAMSGPVSFEAARGRIRGIWSDLGFGFAALPERVVATPACGLAGATQDHARAVLKALGELAKWLVDAPSEAAR
jgi:methionine synthase II (cobalamin-independent)